MNLKIKLFSIPISITSKSEALAVVRDWLQKRKLLTINHQPLTIKFITTPNPEMIVTAQLDPEFLKALQSADLAIPDGIGIVWAVRLLHKRKTVDDGKLKVGVEDRKSKIEKSDPSSTIHSLPPSSIVHHPLSNFHLLSGLDFMEALIEESAKNGWKVMLLGGKSGVADRAAEKLLHQIRPGSALQGRAFIKSIGGPENISDISKSDNDLLITRINSYSPDLLFVAFGHGKQEKWLNVNRKRLNAGVAMGVGGAFDQIVDPSLRPPAIINSIGLGWLYRLFREPWRWRRQLALIKFSKMVISSFVFSRQK